MSETSETLQGLARLGTVIIRKTGIGTEHGAAVIVAACDAPTFMLVDSEGNQVHWRQDLTRPATPTEATDYWRKRAEIVEASHARLLETLNKAMEQNQQLLERLNRQGEE